MSEGDRLPGCLKPETVELEVDGPRALVTKLERGWGSPHGRLGKGGGSSSLFPTEHPPSGSPC